ncbi:dGTPase [Nitrosospira sp. Nsp18]|uniref:dGTP triphosphohydrolase n=1 Tax=Nitrosospira sp. Nsp18 TaxID=1855334 RepID=UPI000881C9A6|nr:dNTP triphosphohydrolase [Nitrosospira sp. Nsp18]SDA20589.1 dGTPase [Nitrosospira sp. Nsp18]
MDNAGFEILLSLISEKRLRDSTQGARGLLIASESDKARVINSSSFRRLQQKAQVFPLEPNAAVRTRLTHSIEVSQIGRHLAQKTIENFGSNTDSYDKLAAFVNTIETACLLHDIGNPPFGHLGESAIKEWFTDPNNESPIPDLADFDGNPQGFRLMSFLGGADDYGFNLTCTLLLSTIKHPWNDQNKPADKKIGIFSADFANYEKACEYLKWIPGQKFPFVRLMDTADEIAYSMSDLEDGLEKGIISEDDLKTEFGRDYFPKGVLKPFLAFKIKVINQAVNVAAGVFKQRLEAFLTGEDHEVIDKNSEVGALLEKVSHFARARIYSDQAAEQVELAGRSVIQGLLKHFGELIKMPEDDFSALISNDIKTIKKKRLDFQIRLFRRLPTGYWEKYKSANRGEEKYRRAHLIVDFIAGMTDDFALETYQILEGIRIK